MLTVTLFTQWVNHLFYNLSLFSFYIYKTQMKKKLISKGCLVAFIHIYNR